MAQFPGAIQKPISTNFGLVRSGGKIDRTAARPGGTTAVIYHVAASKAASLRDYFNLPAVRASSHLFVLYSGLVEQYVDADHVSWACGDGDLRAITVETQGVDGEPWTDAQVETLAQIAAWAHRTYDVPLRLMTSSATSQHGLGWHRLGVQGNFSGRPGLLGLHRSNLKTERWSSAFGKTCPGDDRILQMPTILARAKQITGSSDPGPSPAPAPAAGIKKIQQALADLGYLDTEKWLIDGVLGDATRAAVRTYQHDAGLVTDGDPGPITTTALEADMATVKTLATDSQKLKAATERNERRLEVILEQLAAVAGAVTDLVAEIRTADLVKGRERIEQNNAVLSQLDPRNPKNQKGA
jgi:hypothetical protein